MPQSALYAFYGSLRQGMPLFEQFRNALEYQYSVWLPGYELYSLGDYPYAVKSHDNSKKILAEIFRFTDKEVEEKIIQIEFNAGYILEEIRVRGEVVKIFLFEQRTNNLRVESGDWVTFFRDS
jgi:gamma-glutamylcyclotransferase (GGCT)/AIG2-like uncharacterized protein YtfP